MVGVKMELNLIEIADFDRLICTLKKYIGKECKLTLINNLYLKLLFLNSTITQEIILKFPKFNNYFSFTKCKKISKNTLFTKVLYDDITLLKRNFILLDFFVGSESIEFRLQDFQKPRISYKLSFYNDFRDLESFNYLSNNEIKEKFYFYNKNKITYSFLNKNSFIRNCCRIDDNKFSIKKIDSKTIMLETNDFDLKTNIYLAFTKQINMKVYKIKLIHTNKTTYGILRIYKQNYLKQNYNFIRPQFSADKLRFNCELLKNHKYAMPIVFEFEEISNMTLEEIGFLSGINLDERNSSNKYS